ncbi:RrF2 family transcriptional regulator [Cellulosilyticum sp. I15G10I2]|uniref:RrF2 family transcriptional regulator n=1 Tax=Cellulosilyticum sp. I15G10I2 TaxID=1892843 RepID=UPI00085CAC7D|nr:Rrf2 family transcriptional regulator [Cellulosilyticum sp. I15G10I2]
MKFSTKARYGLRALVDLAVHSGGEQLALIHIAKRQELSVNYLEQVFSLLKKSNIVKSVKGSQGGYMLARKPSEITVGDVIRAIEGEIVIVEKEEQTDDKSLVLQNMHQCLWQNVWQKMTESICDIIDHMTIEDLMKDYQMLSIDESLMYYI